MIRLKYTGCRTYTGYGIFVSVASPFVEVADESAVALLLETGRFVAAGEAERGAGPPVPTANGTPNAQWTTKQLKAYAAENGIDLGGASKQVEIFAKIQEAESVIDFSAEV